MKYFLMRCFRSSYSYKKEKCRLCKKDITQSHIGLSYRNGNGIFMTDKYHDICAVRTAPLLVSAFMNRNKKNCTDKQFEEIRKELENIEIQKVESLFNEKKWWDSGYLYHIQLAENNTQTCDLSNKKIEKGRLIVKRPYINYAEKKTYTFLLENAIRTTDFDWDNLADRIITSMHERKDIKEKISLELKRIYKLYPMEQLNTLFKIIENEKKIVFNIFGLDRQKIKKELLCYDIYFEKLIDKKNQLEINNLFKDFSCICSDDIHLLIKPGKKKVTIKYFKEEILNILKAIEEPIFSAHFCKAGDYRLSRAITYMNNNLTPFPFLFFNHNAYNKDSWTLYIKFKQSLPDELKKKYGDMPLLFKGYWINKNILFSDNALWLWTSGNYWEGIEQKTEDEIYLLNDQYPIEMGILNNLNNNSTSLWGEWSGKFISKDIISEFNIMQEYFKKERKAIVESFDIEGLYKNAKEIYEHGHKTGDIGVALKYLCDIVDRRIIPYELKDDTRVKEINSWINEFGLLL